MNPDQPPNTMPTDGPAGWTSPAEVHERERRSLTRIIRLAFLVVFVVVTTLTILDTDAIGPRLTGPGGLALKIGWQQVLIVAATLALVVIIIDALTTKKRISTLVAIFTGLVIALLSTYALGKVIDLLADIYTINSPGLVATAKILTGIALSYLAIVTVLQTKDEFRLVIPYVEFAKSMRGPRPLVIDSSALIDGRIAELAGTGVLQAPLIIPRCVIDELQLLADQSDAGTRAKGRRGLDLIARLQRTAGVDVTLEESTLSSPRGVDHLLVEIAAGMRGMILTTDSGLERVAAIHGVRVVNVHDVAAAVRPVLAMGDRLTLRLIKPGEQPNQAVGYLDDGTMVVAEDGRGSVGQTITLTVVSLVHTSAGRLVFGRIHAEAAQVAHTPVPPAQAPVGATEPQPDPIAPTPAEPPEAPETVKPPATVGPFPPKPADRRFRSQRNPRR